MGDTTAQLEILRPLGKLEQIPAACHHIGYKLLTVPSPGAFDLRGLIYAAVADVARKHRILFAIPVNEDTPDPYFASLPSVDLTQAIVVLERSKPLAAGSGENAELDRILQDQHNTDFKSGYGTLPSWRLVILQCPKIQTEFIACFIYHYAIGDGIAGLAIHNAFREALELHDLPINPSPPKPPAVKLNAWTGNPIHLPCNTSNNFIRVCKQKGQSVTSVLNLASFVGPLTCIIPVNLRPWLKVPPNAIGTYFDAITAQFTRPDQIGRDLLSADIRAGAQKSLNSDKRLPLQLANFRSVPDVGVVFNLLLGSPRDAAFEVTNAGLFRPATTPVAEESASFWEIEKVLPSRSAAAAGAAITVSVATGGSGVMGLGFSWQLLGPQAVTPNLKRRLQSMV
ncbi:hypothetical protein BDW75DRAFT_233241 [Aspergillus navahoensis]